MTDLRIVKHEANQHGYPVSLVKYEEGELIQGFTLISHKTFEAQQKYAADLAAMTGYRLEEDF